MGPPIKITPLLVSRNLTPLKNQSILLMPLSASFPAGSDEIQSDVQIVTETVEVVREVEVPVVVEVVREVEVPVETVVVETVEVLPSLWSNVTFHHNHLLHELAPNHYKMFHSKMTNLERGSSVPIHIGVSAWDGEEDVSCHTTKLFCWNEKVGVDLNKTSKTWGNFHSGNPTSVSIAFTGQPDEALLDKVSRTISCQHHYNGGACNDTFALPY